MAEKCPFCKTKIKDSDEIVICQKCGTTYHRCCCEYFLSNCQKCGEYIKPKNTPETCSAQPTKSYPGYDSTYASYPLDSEETGLFSNVGEKIKVWAAIITAIGIIAGVITFLVVVSDSFLAGVLAGIGVFLSTWTTSLLLYAFGELVTNSKESKKIQQQILDELKNKKE